MMEHFKKGSVLYSPGQQVERCFYLDSGYLVLSSINQRGEEIGIHIYTPGSILPIIPIMLDKENNFWVKGFTDFVGEFRDLEEVKAEFQGGLESANNLNLRLLSALDNLSHRLTDWSTESVDKRVLATLIYFKRLFGVSTKKAEWTPLSIKITQEEIAMFAATSRESVNRSMKNLKEEGLVKISRTKISVLSSI